MSWTKRELIMQAYEDAAMASYVFDLTPEDLQSALNKLDALMAMWALKGINIGYNVGLRPGDSDLDQPSGIPTVAVFAVTNSLAQAVANMHGKVPPAHILLAAKEGYEALCKPTSLPQMPRSSTMPRGAGNRGWGRFYRGVAGRPDIDTLGDVIEP